MRLMMTKLNYKRWRYPYYLRVFNLELPLENYAIIFQKLNQTRKLLTDNYSA